MSIFTNYGDLSDSMAPNPHPLMMDIYEAFGATKSPDGSQVMIQSGTPMEAEITLRCRLVGVEVGFDGQSIQVAVVGTGDQITIPLSLLQVQQ